MIFMLDNILGYPNMILPIQGIGTRTIL